MSAPRLVRCLEHATDARGTARLAWVTWEIGAGQERRAVAIEWLDGAS